MNGFAYVLADGQVEAIDLDRADGAHGDLVWVHLDGSGDAVDEWLAARAGLSDHVVDALTASESRPRCEPMDGGAFLNLRGRAVEPAGTSDPLASIRLHAMRGRVHSVTRRHLIAMPAVREQMAAGALRDPGDLIVAFAGAITEDLDPYVAELGDTLDACEEGLDGTAAFELRRTVNDVRREAIGYRRFLSPQRAALERLGAMPGEWLGTDDRLHVAAAADRAARMAEEVDAIRERAALVHETLTDLRAEQIDQRSLTIAVVAMVFLPLTFLTGLLGMNVDGIPFAHEPWAFAAVAGLCLAMAGAILAWFVMRHWLNR